MRKIIIILVTFLLFTSTAYAETMYLTEQTWAYHDRQMNMDVTSTIYCEGEAVDVIKAVTVENYKWSDSFNRYIITKGFRDAYIIERHGRREYISPSLLSSEKPKYSYRVRDCHRIITINANSKIYETPAYCSEGVILEDKVVLYTIGQTTKWYQIYHEGRAYFIRKNSKNIIDDRESIFPKVILDNVKPVREKSFKYYYSLLPQEIRNGVSDIIVTLSDWEDDDPGAAGRAYLAAGEIKLKENKNVNLIYATLHEIGHIVCFRNKFDNSDMIWMSEKDNLQLTDYHKEEIEYYAECFELYIKQPEVLKVKAPMTYEYYESLVKN